MILKHCLLCGEGEKVKVLYEKNFDESQLTAATFSARRVTEHFHYKIVRCICGLVFSREILPEAELARLYSASAMTFEEHIPVIRRDYARHLKPFLRGRALGSALEIGCSNGFFLEELKQQGFREVFGCEPSRDAVAKAHPEIRPQIHAGFFKAGVYAPQSFDLVCSFQTIDHLSEPLEVLKAGREILKPGGLAYFICHNTHALQARLLGEKSPIIDVEHIYLFNPATLRALFEKAGFRVEAVGNVKNSYPLRYWVKMLPLPAGWKRFLENFLRFLRLSEAEIPVSAGNIFIIAS